MPLEKALAWVCRITTQILSKHKIPQFISMQEATLLERERGNLMVHLQSHRLWSCPEMSEAQKKERCERKREVGRGMRKERKKGTTHNESALLLQLEYYFSSASTEFVTTSQHLNNSRSICRTSEQEKSSICYLSLRAKQKCRAEEKK